MNIVQAAVGIFTATGIGMGPGSITNFFTAADQPLNTHHEPVAPGGVATFWVTGVGGINAPDNQPPLDVGGVVNLRSLNVIVGDVPVTSVLYAGRSAQFPGLDQVIVELAPTTPTGCYVPAVIGADGVFSNYVTLAVGRKDETCVDEDNPFSGTLTSGGIVGGFGAVRNEFNISADLMAQWTGAALGGEPLGKGLGSVLAHLMKGDDEMVNFQTDAVLTKFSESSGNGLAFNPVFSWAPKNVFSAAVVRGITFEDFFGGEMIPFVGNMPGSEIGTINGRSFPPSSLSEKGGTLRWETWTTNGEGLEHFPQPSLYELVDLFNDPNPEAGEVAAFFSFVLRFLYGGSAPSPFSMASIVPDSSGLHYNWALTDPSVQFVLLWGIAELSEEDAFAIFCGLADADLGELRAPNHVLHSVGIMPAYELPAGVSVVGGIAAMPGLEEPGFFNFRNDNEGLALEGSVYNFVIEYDFNSKF